MSISPNHHQGQRVETNYFQYVLLGLLPSKKLAHHLPVEGGCAKCPYCRGSLSMHEECLQCVCHRWHIQKSQCSSVVGSLSCFVNHKCRFSFIGPSIFHNLLYIVLPSSVCPSSWRMLEQHSLTLNLLPSAKILPIFRNVSA